MGSLARARAATSDHDPLQQAKDSSDREATELAQLETALALSRKEHLKWTDWDPDAFLLASMQAEHVDASGLPQAQVDDLLFMQRDILESVAEQSEREYMDAMARQLSGSTASGLDSLDAEAARTEAEMLEQARLASLSDLGVSGVGGQHFSRTAGSGAGAGAGAGAVSGVNSLPSEDAQLAWAMQQANRAEDEALAQALRDSASASSAAAVNWGGSVADEDAELHRALQMSLSDVEFDEELQKALQESLRK
jgi:hypothetical protein